MGAGWLGDALLGAALVMLVWAARRRLRWFSDAAREAGPAGFCVALMAAVVLAGGVLFGSLIMPGPSFTVGGVLTAAAIFAVQRQRSGTPVLPQALFRWRVDPLIIGGLLVGAAGLAVGLHAAWTVDVTEVNNILRAVSRTAGS